MINYYYSPIPGFGVSFSFKNLILDQALFLARQIEVSTIKEIQQRFTAVYPIMERARLLRICLLPAFSAAPPAAE